MGINSKFPSNVQRLLEEKGYYKLSKEERISKHDEMLDRFRKVPHPNYEAGRQAFTELRGE